VLSGLSYPLKDGSIAWLAAKFFKELTAKIKRINVNYNFSPTLIEIYNAALCVSLTYLFYL